LKFLEYVPFIVIGVRNVTFAGGFWLAEANGGNGLSPPVAANPAHGLSKGIQVVFVPFKV
jgi:hypothetical protein